MKGIFTLDSVMADVDTARRIYTDPDFLKFCFLSLERHVNGDNGYLTDIVCFDGFNESLFPYHDGTELHVETNRRDNGTLLTVLKV